ncbi:hypothetical protein Lalb_Chr10g0093981 [Lupinus albus]|uniref:Uncharacterized protein n=1 Tax=Lupinus albus TaxID=3870 RepID=A0A6A4PUE6_LUPAL|nr:hypothetical protein Lalb_Chr10g0093981 [Lupinus albus]
MQGKYDLYQIWRRCWGLSVHTKDIFGTNDIFGHYKWKMCAKVKIVFSYRIFNSVLGFGPIV